MNLCDCNQGRMQCACKPLETGIQRYAEMTGQRRSGKDRRGSMVTHDDHVASHAYDEAKEQALFEAAMPTPLGVHWDSRHERYMVRGSFYLECLSYQGAWTGWKACAMSRAAGVKS